MENSQIADAFDLIADLLELKAENAFRIRAYRNAARTVRGLASRLEDLARQEHALLELPGIGEDLAGKIREILDTATCKRLEELRRSVPAGITDLMRVPGLGPRKAMRLHEELHVASLDKLKQACEAHAVRGLAGMGAKTEADILRGLATLAGSAGRILYSEAAELLGSLGRHLDTLETLQRWVVAGSFRRAAETIGDLDILVQAANREQAANGILACESIGSVSSRGREKISVRLKSGTQVDFRFIEPEAFGAALMYFTGSKAHNIRVRRIAQEKNWKLSEYGLFQGERLLTGDTEEAVYKRLGLAWVPPELREDRGEVEAARSGRLPRLIEAGDVRGDLQCHTTASDGRNSIREMAEGAAKLGHDFLAITDHSKRVTVANGLDDERLRKHADAIRKVAASMKGFWLLAGVEVDILKNGALDLKAQTLRELDWVVGAVHYDLGMSRQAMTDRLLAAIGSGLIHCLGHPLSRLIGKRDPIQVDLDKLFQACAEHGVCVEINCQPERLDLPDSYCRQAKEAGVRFTFGTDAHTVAGLQSIHNGVNVARRGWLAKGDVLNTLTAAQLRRHLVSRSRSTR